MTTQPGQCLPETAVRVSPQEGYRLWAGGYDGAINPLLALEKRVLSTRLGNLAGKVFLDAGCGTGRWAAEAAARGARVVGVDCCDEMLKVAAGKDGLTGRLVLADNRRLPLRSGCIDFAICSFSLSYLQDPWQAVEELDRATKPGASIVLSDFHPLAHEAGWKRSFRHGAQVLEIMSYEHSRDLLIALGSRAGWSLEESLEARLGRAEHDLMRQAGREAAFEELSLVPAILILLWNRR